VKFASAFDIYVNLHSNSYVFSKIKSYVSGIQDWLDSVVDSLADALPPRPVRSSVPTGVGTLVTHGKGGVSALYQDEGDANCAMFAFSVSSQYHTHPNHFLF
jgi:hypothetical protein